MASDIPNIQVPYSQWLNLNTTSGVEVGSMMGLINMGATDILVEEGSVQPSKSSLGSAYLTPRSEPNASCTVTKNSGTIWVKSASENYIGLISVQTV